MTNDFIASNEFLKTYDWRKLRQEVLDKYDSRCMCCGSKPSDDKYLCVDHIKPRKTHPELALDIGNLQILCNECNHGKGNWSVKDFRGNGTFIITEHWLNSNCTPRGGYTKEQFKSISVSNKSGWKKRIVGLKITEDERVAFENARFINRDTRLKIQSNKKEDFLKSNYNIDSKPNKIDKCLLSEVDGLKKEVAELREIVLKLSKSCKL